MDAEGEDVQIVKIASDEDGNDARHSWIAYRALPRHRAGDFDDSDDDDDDDDDGDDDDDDGWSDTCHKSETFPSEGGPDCPQRCARGTHSYYTHFWLGRPVVGGVLYSRGLVPRDTALAFEHGFNLSKWQEQMNEGTAIMRKLGHVLSTDAMAGVQLTNGFPYHLSFNYFCCYTPYQWIRIKEVLRYSRSLWNKVQKVTWDRVVCRIDGPSKTDQISLILLADDASNKRLMRWIGEVEARLLHAGLPVHVSRSKQQPFHVTLGTVNGSSDYPVDKALDEINAKLHSWEGIVLKPHQLPN